jgi:hypothetical protein
VIAIAACGDMTAGPSPSPPDAAPLAGAFCTADTDCTGGAAPMFCVQKAGLGSILFPVGLCTIACTSDAECTQQAIGQTGWVCDLQEGDLHVCIPSNWLD